MEAENDTVAVVDASTPADVKVEKETMIALVSRNGQKFQVPKAAAVLSGFIKDTLDIDDEDEEPENYQSVHVLRVNGDCLQKVVDFLVHYHQDPIPEISQPLVGNSLHEVNCSFMYPRSVHFCKGALLCVFSTVTIQSFQNSHCPLILYRS